LNLLQFTELLLPLLLLRCCCCAAAAVAAAAALLLLSLLLLLPLLLLLSLLLLLPSSSERDGSGACIVGCSLMPLDLEARIVVTVEWNSGEVPSNGDADTAMWCDGVVALAW
jgi:hypothetical protein